MFFPITKGFPQYEHLSNFNLKKKGMGKLIFLLISLLALSEASPKHRRQASEQKCGVRNLNGVDHPEIKVSKGGLISESFSFWFKSLKKALNYVPKHYFFRCIVLRGVIWHIFM